MRRSSSQGATAAQPPEMRYLGRVPVTDIGESFTQQAVEILLMKLQRLQKKMVDKVVEKKHGSRLSEASPIYQKIAAKLANSDMDCTRGDKVHVLIDNEAMTMVEPSNDTRTAIGLHDILSLTLLPPREGDTLVFFSFIQEVDHNHLQCHVLQATPSVAETCRISLSTAVRQAAATAASQSTQKKGMLGKAVGLAAPAEKNKITFGVGLHKKSSIRVSDGLRRKGTVNLKGKSSAEVKRRSSTYGGTFASLLPPTGAAVNVDADEDELPLDAASMSPHSEGDEDDLLAGIEEDIFGQDDVLGEDDERGMSNMDDLNLDLEHFGFGGDVTEDDEDDGC
eukprot:m.16825 g.16825  ORF g.16825 m.16825 type:complete len:337 (+) comp3427_c0_seq2:32-1042(+)